MDFGNWLNKQIKEIQEGYKKEEQTKTNEKIQQEEDAKAYESYLKSNQQQEDEDDDGWEPSQDLLDAYDRYQRYVLDDDYNAEWRDISDPE